MRLQPPPNNVLNYIDKGSSSVKIEISSFVYQLNSAICRAGAFSSDPKGVVSKMSKSFRRAWRKELGRG